MAAVLCGSVSLAAGQAGSGNGVPSQTNQEELNQTYGAASKLYEQKRYGDAAKLLEPIFARGPELYGAEWYTAMYDLACDEALAGNREQALKVLAASQSNGGSTSGEHLGSDKDLLSLHGDPQFERIVAEARGRDRLWAREPGQEMPFVPNLSEDEKVAALSTVWSEVRFNFAFFDRQPALDWNQLYLEYLPKVRATTSTAEFYRVLIRFMAELKDGHSNVYAPAALADQMYARPALRTALIEGRVVVVRLLDRGLDRQGWRVGDEILTVNGKPVKAYAEDEVAPYVSASTAQDRAVRTFSYGLFSGDVNKPLDLLVRDANGKEEHRVLRRLSGAQAGALPKLPGATFAVRPDGVAVLTVNEFEDTKGSELLVAHLAEARAAKGLVIDVRANGGGNTDMTLLQILARAPIQGPMQRTRLYRAVDRPWGAYPGWADLPQASYGPDAAHHIDVPVAVLTSAMTFSAAEDFVAAFNTMHRGVTVGEATGGSTGQPMSFALPGGGSARVCTKNDRAGDSTVFEGVGLLPTIEVAPTVASVRSGADPVMERAVEALLHGAQGTSATARK